MHHRSLFSRKGLAISEMARTGKKRTTGRIVLHILCVLLVTVLLICAFLYGVIFMLCRGPSETARNLFVRSVRETSAIGFLANLCLSNEEIAAIEASQMEVVPETDVSLIEVTAPEERATDENGADAWGYVDDDGDGVIAVPVSGETYSGYMLIVLDAKKVKLGFSPEDVGIRGYTVAEFGEKFGAIAAINGGGFVDPNGFGDGSTPNNLVVQGGEIYCGYNGIGDDFAGIDDKGILHVGIRSVDEIREKNIQEGVGYGPVLVANGQPMSDESLMSGLNPRTAIGQRSDGAILMLVVDGRRATSLGASFKDEAEQMLAFGAVNATNLDGGSSSLMWMNGEYLNNKAAVIGVREIPDAFLVMP